MRETWVWSLVWEDPRRRHWQPTPVVLPGESSGRRSLVGYSPLGRKESDTTVWLHSLTHSHHMSRMKDKNHMIISKDAKKKLTKFNILSYRLGTEGIYLSIIKVIYDEYTSNIKHNSERLKTFSLRSWTRQRVSIPTTLFNIVLQVLVRELGNKNKEKNPNQKGRNKLSLLMTWSFCRKSWGIPWLSSGLDYVLSLPKVWVWSLVEELRFCKSLGMAKNKK